MKHLKKITFALFLLPTILAIYCKSKSQHSGNPPDSFTPPPDVENPPGSFPTPPDVENPPPSDFCTDAHISYSTCSSSTGCTLSFECPYLNQAEDIVFKISSLTINSPSLLAKAEEVASKNWYKNQIDCKINGGEVTCPNFLPIANDFTLNGLLNDKNVTVNVTVTSEAAQVTNCGDVICGEAGTTVQRMFDCSERVAYYAGRGNGSVVNHFKPGDNPDPYWFLVSSPKVDSTNQQCFWLSPKMVPGNPSLGNGSDQFDSFHHPMNETPYLGGRLLWSGLSLNSYTFYGANKNGGQENYDMYFFLENKIANFRGTTAYSLENTICQKEDDPQRLAGSIYQWQMPSYPMLMTLTKICGPQQECNPAGFYATDSIPGFLSSAALWSSSTRNLSGGGFAQSWIFRGNNTQVTQENPIKSFQVRCVSGTW